MKIFGVRVGVLIIIFAILLGILHISKLGNTLELYILMHYKPFPSYINCNDLLNKAASKTTVYSDVSEYMNEEIYNNLSIKTKSYYNPVNSYDEVIQVIHQKTEANNPCLVYIDIIQYNTSPEYIKRIRLRQLIAQKDSDTSWKLIKYVEPMTWNWYKPTYFEYVYSIILPHIEHE